jgi:hypothetical protein
MGDSASAAPDVTGSHDGTIVGRASVDMPGTPLTPAEFAQNVEKSGNKPSACTANNGHGTTIGMCGKKAVGENSAKGYSPNMTYVFALMILLLAPGVVTAQFFEGEIHTKVIIKDGRGFAIMYLSKLGARNEIDIHSPTLQSVSAQPYRMTTLQRFSEPNLIYTVNNERKVYSVVDLKKTNGPTKSFADDTYTVTRLGSDTIAGYTCEKVRLTSQNQTETDLCVAKNIAGMEVWIAMMERTAQIKRGMFTAIKRAGVEGLPIKMVVHRKEENLPIMTTEVVRVEEKSLAASLFEVPSTYKKEDVISLLATPEMAEKMQNFVDKMTPVQRKRYEDMRDRMLGK